jgi:hypothetical protein
MRIVAGTLRVPSVGCVSCPLAPVIGGEGQGEGANVGDAFNLAGTQRQTPSL